jgi:hypothetical protein
VSVERLFTSPQEDLVLVIDGVDEAPLAARREGLVMLLRSVKELRIPFVLTMRTEFWDAKKIELQTALTEDERRGSTNRRAHVIELVP